MPMVARVTVHHSLADRHRTKDNRVGCAGKTAYRSRKHARDGLKWVARQIESGAFDRIEGAGRLEPYECPIGHGWHIGHRPDRDGGSA